jgi:phosphinothricin acetyltransferase
MAITVRAGAEPDLDAINDIYNHYIATSPVTFDVEPFTAEQRAAWFSHYSTQGRYRLLVAVEDGAVAGYATSSPHRPKHAYETTVETTIYLSPAHVGRGIGATLYGALFEALEGEDLHRAYAGITQPNPASVALHERFGFTQAGLFTEQGRKFGRYWDVAWYEKKL